MRSSVPAALLLVLVVMVFAISAANKAKVDLYVMSKCPDFQQFNAKIVGNVCLFCLQKKLFCSTLSVANRGT